MTIADKKVPEPRRQEFQARLEFEAWASRGTRPYLYPLRTVANGEYVSLHTENVWLAYKDGYYTAKGWPTQ